MIKKLCYFGFDTITTSVLERPSKNGVKSVDQRSPPVKLPNFERSRIAIPTDVYDGVSACD